MNGLITAFIAIIVGLGIIIYNRLISKKKKQTRFEEIVDEIARRTI